MINDKEDKVIKELFQSLLSRSQIGLKTSMKGSCFIFDCVHLLYYKCHTVNFRRIGLYIDSSDWIKNKNPTIDSIKKRYSKCFQCPVAAVLNHEKIKKIPVTN